MPCARALRLARRCRATFAQERTGGIAGTIKDSSGAILPGATVRPRARRSSASQTAVERSPGELSIPGADAGRLRDHRDAAGLHGRPRRPNVRLGLGQLLKIDLALAVATLTESVQVTAESPIIDVKQNAAVASITPKTIERMPKARDFTDLVEDRARHAAGAEVRHPDRRRRRLRAPLRDRRHGHHRHPHRRVGPGDAGRLHPGSAGQVVGLQRRVPRHDRRRDQRHHQDRQQRVARRRRLSTSATTASAATPADAAAAADRCVAGGVHHASGR